MREARDFRVEAPDGVGVALHRLASAESAGGTPVLFVPGTFTNRHFWLGSRGQGFAASLAAAGFDAWVLEPRGHGESDRPRDWTLTDWVEHDAPTAAQRVLDETGASGFYWVGHSAGGVVGAAFIGGGHPVARRMRGLVLIGSPGPGRFSGARRWLSAGGFAAATLLPRARLPGSLLGLGPEHEPASLVREWLGWNLAGVWRDPRGGDYLAGLGALSLPVLAVAGEGDRLLAPPRAVSDLLDRFGTDDRTLSRAGRGTGFREDYDHAGLMIGRGAREEIWPRIVGWLARRMSRPDLEPCDPRASERA